MGQILSSYYEKASKIGGISTQVKLAMITRIASKQAAELPDSPENIKIFEDAFKQLQ